MSRSPYFAERNRRPRSSVAGEPGYGARDRMRRSQGRQIERLWRIEGRVDGNLFAAIV